MQLPKVNATLAAFVLADIARATGRNFPLRDRISREEAAALANEFARSPAMRSRIATAERTEAGRRGVRLYREVLSHFASGHPSDAAGQPQPWDVPAHVATDPQNPFKGMPAAHAESLVAWALVQPSFREARLDRHHPQHSAVAEQWRQLHEAAYPQPGSPAAASPAAPAAVAAQPFAPAPPAASPSSAIDSAARLRAELAQMPKTDRRREQVREQLIALTQSPS